MKGQAWVQDAVLSVVIIIIAFTIFMNGYSNLMTGDDFEDIYKENNLISEYLMLEGTPSNWNSSNVIRIGILNQDKSINISKLQMFNNISTNNYDESREYLKTRFDYFIYFTDYNNIVIDLINDSFIGKSGVNNTNLLDLDTKSISKIERYIIRDMPNSNYRDIIKMHVYSWEEI